MARRRCSKRSDEKRKLWKQRLDVKILEDRTASIESYSLKRTTNGYLTPRQKPKTREQSRMYGITKNLRKPWKRSGKTGTSYSLDCDNCRLAINA